MAGNPFDQFDAPQGGFTPIPGMAPNPKMQPEVQNLQLGNKKAATLLPFEAQKAAVEARTAGPLAAASLRKTNADAIAAEAQARKVSGQPAPLTPQQRANQLFQNDEIMQTIGQASDMAGRGHGTGFESWLSMVPATEARKLSNHLDVIRSNLTIDNLMKLKSESSTGASGMGQLSNKEGDILASTVAKLDQGLSGKDLQAALNKVRTHYMRFRASTMGIDPNSLARPAAKARPQTAPTGAKFLGWEK